MKKTQKKTVSRSRKQMLSGVYVKSVKVTSRSRTSPWTRFWRRLFPAFCSN